MARYTYAILSTSVAGREQEFRDWYRNQHLDDVARLPGVISARLLFPDVDMVEGAGARQFTSLTLYELESEDPKASINALFAKGGTDAMPLSDAMDMGALVQFVGHQVHSVNC